MLFSDSDPVAKRTLAYMDMICIANICWCLEQSITVALPKNETSHCLPSNIKLVYFFFFNQLIVV